MVGEVRVSLICKGRYKLFRDTYFHLRSCCRRGALPPSTYDLLFPPGWLDANNNNNNSNTVDTKPKQRIRGGFTIHSNNVCTHYS